MFRQLKDDWSPFRALILIIGLSLAAGPALSNENIPENASAKVTGSGWECNPGYRDNGGNREEFELPANAYSTGTRYGRGWDCTRGYRTAGDACVKIDIPSNAHLDYSGNEWACNRPYTKRQESCELR